MQSVCIAPESKLTSIDFDPFMDGEIQSTASTIVTESKFIAVDFDPFVDGEIQLTAPATASQQEIWLGVQMSHEANLACLLSQSLRFKGRLNIQALQTAFQHLVARHEALRTTFNGDGTMLSIAKKIEFVSPLVDLSNLSSEEREMEIDRHQKQAASQLFNLQHGPLFSTEILKLDDNEHLAILTVHHIICDGWSYGILITELAQIYSALNIGTAIELAPVEYLSEYAFAEREKSVSAEKIATESYWIEKFADSPPVIDLPIDYPRPPIRTFDSACEDYTLKSNLVRDLKQLGIKNNCSLMTTFLAAFEVFLYKITGQTEFTVAVPTSGQTATGKYNLVGHCVNFLPLRSRIEPNWKFDEYLRFRNREILDDYDRQDFTFGSLLKKLAIPRNASRVPLISAVFNIDLDGGTDRSQFDGLTTKICPNRADFATFEFFINAVTAADGQIELNCQYNPKLFKLETIRRRLKEFENLLTALTQTTDRSISSLSLLNSTEQHQLLTEWNQTQTNYPQLCIHQLFESQVKLNGAAIALILEREQLTYHELNHRANQLAHYLIKSGIKPEDLVSIAIERSLETIVGILGILKAGAAYLPLDLASPPTRLAAILEDAQISILLTKQSILTKLSTQSINQVICIDTEWDKIATCQSTNPDLPLQPDNLAYVTYTSGSTGTPKGVCITHRGVVRLVKATNYANFSSDEIFLHLAPLAFDGSTFEIWGSLLNGAKLIVFPGDKLSLANIGATIRAHQITTVFLSTGLFHSMVDERLEDLQSVRQFLSGGDVLSPSHVQKVLAHLPNCRVINGYGPTENTTFTCCHAISKSDPSLTSIPIGKPISNTQVYILDAYLQPVPIGIAGELHTGGDGLARGYLNRPDLTQARFIPNPFELSAKLYKTGDLARYLPDGSIEFLGRIDNQVKIRGFRVEIGEVEAILARHPSIQDVKVIVREDRPGDKRLVAYVVTEKSTNPTDNLSSAEAEATPTATLTASSQELRVFLQSKLPDYLIPSAFVEIDTLPLTLNGKVDRHALPAPEYIRHESQIAPRNEVERQLVEIWERVLDVQPIGIRDNFFELGGHSLIAVRLFAEIEKTFGQTILLSTLFQSQTIEDIATILTPKESAPTTWTSLVEIRSSNSPRPPLFCIHALWGNILFYREFVEYLEIDRKVYGLQSRGLDGKHQPCRSIPEMAANYIKEIQSVQPHGPYLLVGFSLGGLIAFEIAQQLQSQGQEIKLLALVDPYTPDLANPDQDVIPHHKKSILAKIAIHLQILGNLNFQDKITYIRERVKWNLTIGKANIFYKAYLRYIKRSATELRLIEIVLANNLSLTSYTPHHPYNGRITLFTAEEADIGSQENDSLNWGLFATQGLDVESVPGSHLNIMKEPNLGILCAKFNRLLNQLEDE